MSKNEAKTMPLGAAIGIAAVTLAVGLVGGYMAGKTLGTKSGTFARGSLQRGEFVQFDGTGGTGAAVRDGSDPVGGRFGAGMDMVTGDIVSVDGNIVTVGLEDGSSKAIVLTSETAVSETKQADVTALTPGTHVFVSAKADGSGNLVASMLQIRTGDTVQFGMPGTPPPEPPTGQ